MGIVDSFITEFCILLLIAIQCIIFGWLYDIEGVIPVLNEKLIDIHNVEIVCGKDYLAKEYLEKNHVQKMDMQMAYYTMLAQENVM